MDAESKDKDPKDLGDSKDSKDEQSKDGLDENKDLTGEDKLKEKSLEETVGEEVDKKYMAKIIVETKEEIAKLKDLVAKILGNTSTANPLLDSEGSSKEKNDPNLIEINPK